jgi:hypothetical protein
VVVIFPPEVEAPPTPELDIRAFKVDENEKKPVSGIKNLNLDFLYLTPVCRKRRLGPGISVGNDERFDCRYDNRS